MMTQLTNTKLLTPQNFSSQEYRKAMSQFATGITVVTSLLDGVLYGTTVNAFCSLSLEPALVMVSLAKTARSHTILSQSGVYGVNILSASQQNLSERFAGRSSEAKTFDDVDCYTAVTGSPLFKQALTRLDCRVVAIHEAGDHSLFIGEIYHLSSDEQAAPLVYFGSKYHHALS